MTAEELSRLFARLLPTSTHELFRPYRWRDPERVTPERAAELAAIDAAERAPRSDIREWARG